MPEARSVLGRAIVRAARVTVATTAVLAVGALVTPVWQRPHATPSLASTDDPPASTDDPPASPVVRPSEPASAGEPVAAIVKIDRDDQAKSGIETAPPTLIPYQDQVRVYGTVLALDRLTSLYNAALTAAAQLRSAEVKRSASKIANDRAQTLLAAFPSAKAQAEAATAAYELDDVGVEAAAAQIEALRNTAIQDWGRRLGEAILARSDLAKDLVTRKTCLIQLSLQPGAATAPPQRITLTYGAASTIVGLYVAEASQSDPKVQTAGFLYTVPAAPGLLPGMGILGSLPRGDAAAGVGIPPSAVVWQAGKAWVYLQAGSDRFKRHALDDEAYATPDGGYIVPAASLPHDPTLVVTGAQTLLSEESRSQIPSDEDDQ